VVDDFLEFIGDSPLIIHNASFDMMFLNAELEGVNKPTIQRDRAIDTLAMARQMFPGSPSSLDALCKRFQIDLSKRKQQGHGALLDAELLYHVYIELTGGRQKSLGLDMKSESSEAISMASAIEFPYRTFELSSEEEERHSAFIATLNSPLWKKCA
jgi:DNA polymerase-3 subunit epsilon